LERTAARVDPVRRDYPAVTATLWLVTLVLNSCTLISDALALGPLALADEVTE
jgi:hypothetical protein